MAVDYGYKEAAPEPVKVGARRVAVSVAAAAAGFWTDRTQ